MTPDFEVTNFEPRPSDKIQRVIDAINTEHLWKLRQVRGKDLAEHVQDLVEMEVDKQFTQMVILLEEIIEVTHTLVQYDEREPQPYYAEKAATIYMKLGRREDAVRVLRGWLSAWPDDRPTTQPAQRKRIIARIARLENRNNDH